MPRPRPTLSNMGDIPEGEPVGKLGKLRRQVADQADLVDDMGRDLDHTNRSLLRTTEELAYHKNLAGQSKQLEDEQQLSAVEELQYENFVLQLEMSGMHEASQLYDYQTVDEQNQELRGAVSSMQNENVQLSQLIAEDNRAALEREGRTRLFLEREYREQLKGAETRIKDELYSKLDDRTKNIVLEHRRLQDDLFLLKYNIKEFDSRYRQLDDRRKLLNIDNSINQDMNDMLVKETVALRKKLAHSEERRLELEDTVNQLRGQVHLIEDDTGVARSPAQLLSQSASGATGIKTGGHDPSASSHSDSAGLSSQQMGVAQVASLRMELQRMRKHGKGLRDQRDKWRSRALKLEQICGDLQDDLASAIDAAKNIVDQSETGIWASRAGWQVSDGITGGEVRDGAGSSGKPVNTRESSPSFSKLRRPSSALPTPSRTRPSSATTRVGFRGRPKSALSGPLTRHAMSPPPTYPARTVVEGPVPSSGASQVASRRRNATMAVPDRPTNSTLERTSSYGHDDQREQLSSDDGERTGTGKRLDAIHAMHPTGITQSSARNANDTDPAADDAAQPPSTSLNAYPSSLSDSLRHADARAPTSPAVVSEHAIRSGAEDGVSATGTELADNSPVWNEDRIQHSVIDGTAGNAANGETTYTSARPSTARPPSRWTYSEASTQRPASAVWSRSRGSIGHQVSSKWGAHSETLSATGSAVSRESVVGASTSGEMAHPASTVLRRSQSATSYHSTGHRRAVDARPQSPLVRRGQGAQDFVLRTKALASTSGARPFS